MCHRYVIIDDFGWDHGTHLTSRQGTREATTLWGAKNAIMDFRALHGIEDDAHAFRDIDGHAAWFKKAREIDLLHDRYVQSLKKGHSQALLQPEPKLSEARYLELMHRYNELAEK